MHVSSQLWKAMMKWHVLWLSIYLYTARNAAIFQTCWGGGSFLVTSIKDSPDLHLRLGCPLIFLDLQRLEACFSALMNHIGLIPTIEKLFHTHFQPLPSLHTHYQVCCRALTPVQCPGISPSLLSISLWSLDFTQPIHSDHHFQGTYHLFTT